MPGDFKLRSNEIESGNAERAKADLTGYDVIDWPLSYDDLEPYYEKFEWEFGISGQAGLNPFAGPRKRGFPLPPLRHSGKMQLFAEACKKLGYHPYDTAAGIASQPYKPAAPFDTRIAERPACVYCAHCNFYGCHVHAKSASLYITIPVALQTGNFELKTNAKVCRINSDASGRVTGVCYFDADGREHEQSAGGDLERIYLRTCAFVAVVENRLRQVRQGFGQLKRLCWAQYSRPRRCPRHGRFRRLHRQRLHRPRLGGHAHRRFQWQQL
jgi:choline dehydrogenase-like flavoprotein